MFTRIVPVVFVGLSIVLLLATGCHVRQEGTPNAKYYGNDGFKGLTNTNPNLQTSPTHHTYKTDARLMDDVLKDINGIERANVLIHGADAYIGLKLDPSLSDRERNAVEKEATGLLSRMFPRYRIHVTSNPEKAPQTQRPFWGTGGGRSASAK